MATINRITKEHLNKRVLLRSRYSSTPDEFFVLEISPSGKYVKLRNDNDSEYWREITEFYLEEVLDDKTQYFDVNLFEGDVSAEQTFEKVTDDILKLANSR